MIDDTETRATSAGDAAYNKVIIDSVKKDMYKRYGIELFKDTQSGSMYVRKSKSTSELSEELVNAIAIEKAKPRLKRRNND